MREATRTNVCCMPSSCLLVNLSHSHAKEATTRLHAGGAMTPSYEGSCKLRLHGTSPVVGSQRTCDDWEPLPIGRTLAFLTDGTPRKPCVRVN